MILGSDEYAPNQTFTSETIKPGIPYKVSELLERMIIHSDNYATTVVGEQLDTMVLSDLFKTLNIKRSYFADPDFSVTSRDYSKLLRVLYDASYLNEKNSQKALSILTHTDFPGGLVKQLPNNIVVAHKFGENSLRPLKELHESGIIYAGNKTYLLTVMSKGNNVHDLPDFISDISLHVYNYFSGTK
jgi:beta-lactamase class A